MLRTEQILNAKFTPVSKGTYSAEEVDAFLKAVAESYEESLGQNKELMKKIGILADKIESYRADEEAIKLALLDAHKLADSISKEAKEKAEAAVKDAENKSEIILDGANRQSGKMIEEAREQAKEIVYNARTAVASLTERAQIETDNAIAAANDKAAEIVAKAEAEGKNIIGNSKESYEFYSAELAKVKAETEKFKATVQELCKGQLNLLADIPEYVPVAAPVQEETAAVIEEEPVAQPEPEAVADIPAEEEIPVPEIEEEIPEAEAITSAEEILAEIQEEVQIVYAPEEPAAAEVEEPAEELSAPVQEEAEDEEDDLFSFIDDISFENDEIPASLDDLIPSVVPAEAEEDDEFDGFKVDLDSIEGMGNSDDDDDDDFTSLFDSMFDD
ncbi:MAG: DivIVA domain-containing protein [Clostridia bacterium]|nr:DivIVA domain-containing protein [Clostridia bacterium]